MFGSRLGIAGGPLEAVNGVIPGAIIGALVGGLAGNRIGHELDHSSEAGDSTTTRLAGRSVLVETVTYDEVVEYFVKNRPSAIGAVKGALVRKPEGNRTRVTWLFLDEKDEPIKRKNGSIYGKEVLALSIDEDLAEFFDGRSIVIFE